MPRRSSEQSIEEIILSKDKRGISALRELLPANYCAEAADYVLQRPGTVLIATGFYILNGAAVETDGPPGAVAIGTALSALGRRVIYVTDVYGENVLRAAADPNAQIVEFPITGPEQSEREAMAILAEYQPSLLIGIERCAPDTTGTYRNMRSMDITPQTARVDRLFDLHEASVGIGDGGNEIGMGLFVNEIANVEGLPNSPAVTRTTKLIAASVSNWGAWGLITAISQLMGSNLLPTIDEETDRVQRCVDAGAVDGFSGECSMRVDGFDLVDYLRPLKEMRALI